MIHYMKVLYRFLKILCKKTFATFFSLRSSIAYEEIIQGTMKLKDMNYKKNSSQKYIG